MSSEEASKKIPLANVMEKILGYMNEEVTEASALICNIEKNPSQGTVGTYEDYNSVGDNAFLNGQIPPASAANRARWLSCQYLLLVVASLLEVSIWLYKSTLNLNSNENFHRPMMPLEWDDHNTAHMEFCQASGGMYGYRLSGTKTCGPAGLVIRLVPGKTYHLVLHNMANATTNIHAHGLHMSGSGNADDVTRYVDPGDCLIYHWDIPSSALGGTFWLHAHPQGTSMEQLQGGAYSMLIVKDHPNLLDNVPSQKQADIQGWLDNELLLIAFTNGGQNNTAFVHSELMLEKDVWYRLRVLTIDPRGKRVPLEFPQECQVHLAAVDGVWLQETPSQELQHEFEPTGASRMDLAISCPSEGRFSIQVHNTPVATIRVNARTSSESTLSNANPFTSNQHLSWKPSFPAYLQDLSNLDETLFEQHTITLVNRTINDQSWDPETPLLSIEYNSYQEWTLLGSESHPFHIHVFHVQTFGCPPHEDGQFYDTIMSSSNSCRLRFHALDYSERIVVHCHNVGHEDQGMMVWFNVTNGPTQDAAFREEMVCQSADQVLEMMPSI